MLRRIIPKFSNKLVVKRFLLNQTYPCDTSWNKRLEGIDCKLSANDLAIQLQQSLTSDVPISALDFDILMNKINEMDTRNLNYIYDIIKGFRRTQEAVKVFESSAHAAIRNLLEVDESSQIINLIKNRVMTGLFLDEVSVNLLLNAYITKKNWENAFFASAEWILQECISDSKLSIPLCFISCLNFWKESLWKYEPPVVEVSKEPIEYKWVPYLKPNGFDDHFDLCKDCHRRRLLGKCFSTLTDHLNLINDNENYTENINYLKNNLGLLGLALHEKLDLLITKLENWLATENINLNNALIPTLNDLIGTVERTVIGIQVLHPTHSEEKVSETLKKLQDLVHQFRLKGLTDDQDLITTALDFFHNRIEPLCNDEVDLVAEKYKKFNSNRETAFEKARLILINKKILKESKAKLLELTNQEELMKYFEKMPEIMYKAWLAKRTAEEKKYSCKKSNQENLENLKKSVKPKFIVQHIS